MPPDLTEARILIGPDRRTLQLVESGNVAHPFGVLYSASGLGLSGHNRRVAYVDLAVLQPTPEVGLRTRQLISNVEQGYPRGAHSIRTVACDRIDGYVMPLGARANAESESLHISLWELLLPADAGPLRYDPDRDLVPGRRLVHHFIAICDFLLCYLGSLQRKSAKTQLVGYLPQVSPEAIWATPDSTLIVDVGDFSRDEKQQVSVGEQARQYLEDVKRMYIEFVRTFIGTQKLPEQVTREFLARMNAESIGDLRQLRQRLVDGSLDTDPAILRLVGQAHQVAARARTSMSGLLTRKSSTSPQNPVDDAALEQLLQQHVASQNRQRTFPVPDEKEPLLKQLGEVGSACEALAKGVTDLDRMHRDSVAALRFLLQRYRSFQAKLSALRTDAQEKLDKASAKLRHDREFMAKQEELVKRLRENVGKLEKALTDTERRESQLLAGFVPLSSRIMAYMIDVAGVMAVGLNVVAVVAWYNGMQFETLLLVWKGRLAVWFSEEPSEGVAATRAADWPLLLGVISAVTVVFAARWMLLSPGALLCGMQARERRLVDGERTWRQARRWRLALSSLCHHALFLIGGLLLYCGVGPDNSAVALTSFAFAWVLFVGINAMLLRPKRDEIPVTSATILERLLNIGFRHRLFSQLAADRRATARPSLR